MAYDSLEAMFKDIAEAIREKNWTMAPIPAEKFAERIRALNVADPDIGTVWTITENGTWKVPATGRYQVELHGQGGPASKSAAGSVTFYSSGGGSGSLDEIELRAGSDVQVEIGGTNSSTVFGELSIASASGSSAQGNLATAGVARTNTHVNGGYGNKNKPEQPYGNGAFYTSDNGGQEEYVEPGPGAVIITYLGL